MATDIPLIPPYDGDRALRNNPATFPENAENEATFFTTTLPNKANESINAMNTVAAEVEQEAANAESSAQLASNSADAAAASANYVGEWSTLSGAYAVGISVTHQGSFWRLKVATSAIESIEPQVDANWEQVNNNDLQIVARANNTTVDDVANLEVGQVYSGQRYFYDQSNEITYKYELGLNGLVSSISGNVVTINSIDYTVERVDIVNQEQSLGLGYKLFKGQNNKYVEVGDNVPLGTTHASILVVDEIVNVEINPKLSGVVSAVDSSGATIGGSDCLFSYDKKIINSQKVESESYQNCGFTDLEPDAVSDSKKGHEITVDSDGITTNKKPFKAWSYPRGIKDSAVAGSFMLVDGVDNTEPSTQVTGFNSIDDIGNYAGRDTVALFAQVNSSPPLIETSSTTFTATSVTSPDFVDNFDLIDVGMIIDVNFGGGVNWIGGVVTSKTAPDTLNISSWRKIDGTSDPASTPVNGQTVQVNRYNNIWAANFNAIIDGQDKGANQAIGIETGVSCNRAGTGANSKAYYAVNLGGERPEYCFTMAGLWQKGYSSVGSSVWGYGSNGDAIGFKADDSTGNSFQSHDPSGHHLECRDTASSSQVIIRNDGKVTIGTNAESGNAKLNLRGAGSFTQTYNQTEFQIFDPTVALVDRQGFFIAQAFPASTVGADFIIGCGGTTNHQYNLKIQTQGTDRMRFQVGGNIEAGVDNAQTFGASNKRWSEIFAGNGTINTSDERMKSFLGDFSVKEKAVAVKVKALLTKFKWNESIEREDDGGKKARVHVGIGAQSLAEAFASEGLDASDYAMFCYDEWDEEKTVIQTNRGETDVIESEVEQQVFETVLVNEPFEEVKLIDGKYTLTKEMREVEVERPKYETHNVYDENGDRVYHVAVHENENGDKIVTKTPRVISVPVIETVTVTKEVPCEPVYEEVITPAGNRYGVRLDQVLAFIIANT